MRTLLILALAGACTPSIATGDYLCGVQESCPDGLVCNGADNTCVIPTSAVAFACDPTAEAHEPDEDVAHADSLGLLDCVSHPIVIDGCLASHDNDDWFAFTTNPGCTSDAIDLQIDSAVGFEPVTVELFDATGATKLATGAATCQDVEPPDTDGLNSYCIAQPFTPGTALSIHVTPTGDDQCSGNCAFNRYRLTVVTALH